MQMPLSVIDGIPITIKDKINAQGMVIQNESQLNFPIESDAEVTKRLREAGAIILGKFNMDECVLGATTDNPHNDRTHNPWKIGYIP